MTSELKARELLLRHCGEEARLVYWRDAIQAIKDALSSLPNPEGMTEAVFAAGVRGILHKHGGLDAIGDWSVRAANEIAEYAFAALSTRSEGQVMETRCHVIAGSVWHSEDDDCWKAEIQIVGGHEVVAEVYADGEQAVIARQQLVLAAFASTRVEPEPGSYFQAMKAANDRIAELEAQLAERISSRDDGLREAARRYMKAVSDDAQGIATSDHELEDAAEQLRAALGQGSNRHG